MKKTFSALFLVLLMALTTPVYSTTSVSEATLDKTTTAIADKKAVDKKQIEALIVRLNEIKTMDKSELNRAEKKALRVEVRSIKTQVATISGGIYISATAIIVILLLLLLL